MTTPSSATALLSAHPLHVLQKMKPLESPFSNGQIIRKWYHQLPGFLPRQKYIAALEEQIKERGKTNEAEWKTSEHFAVAKRIREILCEHCWEVEFDFAPQDPWFIIGEFEIGDLSEVEALMAIEEEFEVTLLKRNDLDSLTFLDLVDQIVGGGRRKK